MSSTAVASSEPTIEESIAFRRAVERVYWEHRIWPSENVGHRARFEDVVTDDVLRRKVEATRARRAAVESLSGVAITHAELQAELDRMLRHSKDSARLVELLDALGRDPRAVFDAVVLPVVVERRHRGSADAVGGASSDESADGDVPLVVGSPTDAPCTPDTWRSTRCCDGPPSARSGAIAVWTGSEVLVWGGNAGSLLDGRRYDPATDAWSAMAPAPGAHPFATGVWSGSELIVWGGRPSTVTNTGARYNPVTDTWTPTSTGGNVPAARHSHTAVWTGSRMLVWGGEDASSAYVNTGGSYDPASDTWAATSVSAQTPTARSIATSVWTGTQMLVWGGTGAAGYLDTGGRYDPATNTWSGMATNRAPSARANHTAVWTGTEMVVWGGETSSGDTQTGGRYNPSTNKWSTTSTGAGVPGARHAHVAAWTGTRMLVWGGGNGVSGSTSGGSYDVANDAWTAIANGTGAPPGTLRAAAAWTGTRLVVWGGESNFTPVDQGGRYDPVGDTWAATSMGSTPKPRSGHTVVWTGSEMIVWGGEGGNGFWNTGSRYDPATDSWSAVSLDAATPAARRDHTAVWDGSSMIVWGGRASTDLNSGGLYDPATDSWTATSTAAGVPSARSRHVAVWTGAKMIIWSGSDPTPLYMNTGGSYDPGTDTWSPTAVSASTPAGRYGATAIWTGSEMIVWGGAGASGTLGDGGRYQPDTNTWKALASGPSGPGMRLDHSAVWTGREMIVWGGYPGLPGQVSNTGARFDPATNAWTSTSVGTGVPEARSRHTALWTGREMIVWGGSYGFAPSVYPVVGGRYDPASDSWTPTSTIGAPPPGRASPGAVWTGNDMIVWGGRNDVSGLDNGGAYCVAACAAVGTWFPDADADGFGVSTTSLPACSQPPGYTASAGDCNDAAATVFPGAAEQCNGVDDNCNGTVDEGFANPGVPQLRVSRSGSTVSLSWTAAAGVRFDVLSGRLDELRDTGGSYSTAVKFCLANDTSATQLNDPYDYTLPWWYLVREIGCSGAVGSYDDAPGGLHHPRDPDIAASLWDCP